MTPNPITAADLFCGAGGTSTGLLQACADLGRTANLTAINHWDRAIASHTANHPHARHLCQRLDAIRPEALVPSGHLDLLVASPECTHHSAAHNGMPKNDQSRASGWHVVDWVTRLDIDRVFIENVPEYQRWSRLDGVTGKPLNDGAVYQAFLGALRAAGYRVEDRIVQCADFGDAQERRRLFIMAQKGDGPIRWPEPTHDEKPGENLFAAGRTPWRTARDIIDWTLRGRPIDTKKNISPRTFDRVEEGLQIFGGDAFLLPPRRFGNDNVRSVDRPLMTITTKMWNVVLITPHRGRIYHRTLKPHELKASMSFPHDYILTGTQEDQVGQIGNAVPVRTARAHLAALLN